MRRLIGRLDPEEHGTGYWASDDGLGFFASHGFDSHVHGSTRRGTWLPCRQPLHQFWLVPWYLLSISRWCIVQTRRWRCCWNHGLGDLGSHQTFTYRVRPKVQDQHLRQIPRDDRQPYRQGESFVGGSGRRLKAAPLRTAHLQEVSVSALAWVVRPFFGLLKPVVHITDWPQQTVNTFVCILSLLLIK